MTGQPFHPLRRFALGEPNSSDWVILIAVTLATVLLWILNS